MSDFEGPKKGSEKGADIIPNDRLEELRRQKAAEARQCDENEAVAMTRKVLHDALAIPALRERYAIVRPEAVLMVIQAALDTANAGNENVTAMENLAERARGMRLEELVEDINAAAVGGVPEGSGLWYIVMAEEVVNRIERSFNDLKR
ncbi:MAG: hypothetical protein KGI41_03615 [Patescibacteria group bacterium]|nr:hypothetical protein [Patescibacteria group bacterium]MDE1966299.1 hypothetical protein [Patescibacteria group bacterium]